MKITYTFTKQEAEESLRKTRNIASDMEVRVEDSPLSQVSVVQTYALSELLKTHIPADQKIAKIKRLREIIPGLGLADAKYMIEAFMEAKPKMY